MKRNAIGPEPELRLRRLPALGLVGLGQGATSPATALRAGRPVHAAGHGRTSDRAGPPDASSVGTGRGFVPVAC